MDKLESLLSDFLKELKTILADIKKEAPAKAGKGDPKIFFAEVRNSLFGGKLTKTQVAGMEAKLAAMTARAFPVSWMAYVLATSYHETAKRMVPVREGLTLSDAWRKKNLRYYPWYGRGDVQLTWKSNYEKADRELGLKGELVKNPDLALDNGISAQVIVRGMEQGWFSGDSKGPHDLVRHLPDSRGTKAQFKQARRIVNLMDKADLIVGQAEKFQDALIKAGYEG